MFRCRWCVRFLIWFYLHHDFLSASFSSISKQCLEHCWTWPEHTILDVTRSGQDSTICRRGEGKNPYFQVHHTICTLTLSVTFMHNITECLQKCNMYTNFCLYTRENDGHKNTAPVSDGAQWFISAWNLNLHTVVFKCWMTLWCFIGLHIILSVQINRVRGVSVLSYQVLHAAVMNVCRAVARWD